MNHKILDHWPAIHSHDLNHPAALLARLLLGNFLIHATVQGTTVGKIVETEAYLGLDDPAAHSYRGITERTRAMFGPAGHAYIYLSYGIHHCFNVTAGKVGVGEGVLIRALEPISGIELMRRRRGIQPKITHATQLQATEISLAQRTLLTNGPGKLVQAMGIDKHLYGHDLTQLPLYLSAGSVPDDQVAIGPRIGISQAVDLPLRFWVKDNKYVSNNTVKGKGQMRKTTT